MRIPLEYIRDHLSIAPLAFHTPFSRSAAPAWLQIIQYESGVELEPEFLLFGPAESFSESLEGRGLISLGMPSESILEHNHVLVLPPDCDASAIFREMQQLILRLNLWETDLHRILRSENGDPQRSTLDAFFCRASELLTNSIFFHDENFYLLGNSQTEGALGLTQWNYDAIKGGYILPLEILNDFKTNQEYQATMHTHGPQMFSADTFGYRIMYQNIWEEERYRGRICINELNRPFCESDYFLLAQVAEMIHDSFQPRERGSYRQMYSIANLLTRMLRQEPLIESQVSEILLQYNWARTDQYFCCCLFPEERDLNTNTLQYYCTLLTGRFLHCCAFRDESSVIILVNQTKSGLNVPDFRHTISLILRDGLLKAGISGVSDDFMDFYFLYNQALRAYENGRKSQSDLWCFCFEDIRLEYMMRQIVQEFPLRHLCSPDLYTLLKYDQTHTSELYKTFRAYLYNDRNLARTAEILGIHRSTLLFRMKKIEELVKADFSDYHERFYLCLSYQLMDETF